MKLRRLPLLLLCCTLLVVLPAVAPAAESATRKVELYVTSWCPYCNKAKAFLRANDIPFTEYDIEKDRAAAERRAKLESRSGVPLLVVGDDKLVGYSEEAYRQVLKLGKR